MNHVLACAVIIGFALGSVPFGVLVLHLMGGPDPRTVGSGNIGATNVTRAGGRAAGAATLVLDALKGAVPAMAFLHLQGPVPAACAGAAAVAGHCFSPWLRFRGGKGVATFLGVACVLAWPASLAFGVAYLALAGTVRIASIASLGGTWAATATSAFVAPATTALALTASAVLITTRHHANLRRLRAGSEPHMGGRP